jgi:hypothetical protein
MKLSSEKLGSILEQIDADVIPDDHLSLPKLREVFGDHTFFIDDSGLTIIQPLDQHRQTGGLVKISTLGRCRSAASGGSYTRRNGYSDKA